MRILLLLMLLAVLPGKASGFLADSDPQDIFALSEQAPLVLRARLKETKPPAGGQRYFIHTLEVEETLAGKAEGKVLVLQEQIFPTDKGIFPSGEFVTFLGPLPNYTAYSTARSQGVALRLFGGNVAVLPLSEARSEVMKLVKDLLALKSIPTSAEREAAKRSLLFRSLSIANPRLVNDAARVLGTMNFKLSGEEVTAILNALSGNLLSPASQTALITALQSSGNAASVEALKQLAAEAPSTKKWAAIRALETLGIKRSTEELLEDFHQADSQQRPAALSLIVARQDGQSQGFLNRLLAGSETLNLKRDAMEQMARLGGSAYETILLEQSQSRDEPVAMQAIVALGALDTEAALNRLVAVVHSPNPQLRSAAGMALMRSKNPRAAQLYREHFEDKGFGHFHQ